MIKYIGKVCPYCKSTFKEGDDIVVCSECEMPHHKDCWIDNKGCTTFGCQGTIQGIDFAVDTTISCAPKYEIRDAVNVQEPEQPAFCSKCGTALIPGNGFCGKCGSPVVASVGQRGTDYGNVASQVTSKVSQSVKKVMDNYQTNNFLDPELGSYVGSKQEYYMNEFASLKNQKGYASWNTFAFLVAPFWCLYRKMYVPGGVILGLDFVLSLIGGWFSGIIGLAVAFAVGVFANYFYMYDLERRMAKGKTLQGQSKYQYIEQWGGANATIPAVAAVIYSLLCVILFFK